MNRKLTPIFVLLILVLLVTACGGGGDEKEEPTSVPTTEATETPTEAPPPPTPEPEGQSPQELGQEIGVLYVEALEKVTELVAGLPPVEEVQPQVEALKETYVQQLFELGKQREALSEQDKAAVDSAILMEVSALSEQDWYNTYNEAVQHYFDEDYEFQTILVSFNIIGQYANFDLLKDQEPEEAVRLGILDPSEVAEAEPTASSPPEPTSPPETAVDLGEEQRNETGGFAYRPITGYDVFDEPGNVFMSAPDMTSDAGPILLIVGGLADEVLPADQILQEFVQEMGDVELANQGEFSLSGATGQVADVSGTANDGQALTGRIVVLWVNEGQAFMMAGAAPPERWEGEVEPLFQAVLNSISFFEPVADAEPEPPAEPMPAAELDWEPGWYPYTNGNDVKGLALHQGTLYAAGAGGLVVWDVAAGEHVKHTTLDGLLHVSAWDVAYCEIPEPRVIVATEVGLSFFDPASGTWDNTPITPEDSNVAGSDIDLVYCDADNGRLLIGYYGLGILDLNSGEFTRYTDEEGLTWNGVRDLAVSGSDVWVASGYNGVSYISGGQITTYDEDGGMPDDTALSIEVAADGTVWVGTGAGLIKFSGGVWTLYGYENVEDMPGDVYEIEIAADGTVWVGSSYGRVCQFDPASETCLTVLEDPEGRYVTDLLLDDAGNLIYSNNGGVFAYDGGAISDMVVEEDVLVSNFVDSLAIDAAGMLWVGTDRGMQVFDPADPSQPLQLFQESYDEDVPSPGGNWARQLLPQPDGSMWVAITNGEVSYYDGQTWTVYEDYYSYDAIAVDGDGRVWLGDDGEGIAILDGDSASTLTSADGLPDDDVYALLADGEVMWIGCDSGLVRYQDGELELVFDETQVEELEFYSATVLDILLDTNGDLLLGVYGGALRYDGVQVSPLLRFSDLGPELSWASFKEMYLGPDGQLWVGTTEGLLVSADGQNWDRFDTSSGLQSNDVDAVLVDQYGTVWVGGGDNFGGGGLSRYVP